MTGIPREARTVARGWADLAEAGAVAGEPFESSSADALPEPIRRWVRHALDEGVPLPRGAVLTMRGQIRLNAWWPFTATQVVALGRGFIWAARARMFGLPVTGFDRFTPSLDAPDESAPDEPASDEPAPDEPSSGQMRWRLLGAIPVMSVVGADVTRSAAGRLVGEEFFVPSAALAPGLVWQQVDDETARTVVTRGGWDHEVELQIAATGALSRVTLQRWGNPDGGAHGIRPFTLVARGEVAGGGMRVPADVVAGWFGPKEAALLAHETAALPAGAFFRATIERIAIPRAARGS